MRALLLAALLPAAAMAQVPYTFVNGDGCPAGSRLVTQQEIASRQRQICSQMAPDFVRRLARYEGDTGKFGLFGLNYGCQVREFPGTAASSICTQIPIPPPPPGSPCPSQTPAFGKREAPPDPPVQTRNMIRTYEFVDSGQTLVSKNRAFYAVVTPDGDLQVRKGTWTYYDFGAVWQIGGRARGDYFLVQGYSGNLCLYRGKGPYLDQARTGNPVWCSLGTAASPGDYFTILEDNGRLCTYQGKGPDDGNSDPRGRLQLWCSGPATNPFWIEGKRIVSASGKSVGRSLWYGNWPDMTRNLPPNARDLPSLYLRPGTEQRFVFNSDGTIRPSYDPTRCLNLTSNEKVFLGDCAPYPREPKIKYTGWEYCAFDGSIRNRNYPKGCLVEATFDSTKPGILAGYDNVCGMDVEGPDRYSGAWTLR